MLASNERSARSYSSRVDSGHQQVPPILVDPWSLRPLGSPHDEQKSALRLDL
ncbi:Uncharacterised protein [Vibrio cholerae]|nr:Uncharacterised protein [Vibrio cholerae]